MNIEAPSNGIYIVLGEINLLLANLKRNSAGSNKYHHSNSHSNYDYPHDPLSRNFYELKTLLNEHSELNEIDPSTFVAPFLEVIKSEETSGPVTGLALTSVDKFISYGLIGINNESTATCVQQIADSITHARFVGTDSSSDEVVLMKILHVLRTLMLSHIGFCLTNSSVCEIMQSCFQICFEHRLTELLRRTAESILVDMVQLLFARLPLFKEEIKFSAVKKLTMKGESTRQKKVKKSKTTSIISTASSNSASSRPQHQLNQYASRQQDISSAKTATISKETKTSSMNNLSVAAASSSVLTNDNDVKTTTTSPTNTNNTNETLTLTLNASNNILITNESKETQEQTSEQPASMDDSKKPREKTISESSATSTESGKENKNQNSEEANLTEDAARNSANTSSNTNISSPDTKKVEENVESKSPDLVTTSSAIEEEEPEYVNPRGVRFVQDGPNGVNVANIPYGLPCIRELLRFLISLINAKNSDIMISMGLNLITIGLESGIDHISSYQSLLSYIKDDLCKNLFHLLSSERLGLFASVLRVTFLLFESLRGHLKLQLEHFFIKLMEIIVTETNKVSQEQKEMTIDYFLQMLRIPGFAIELYLNYDCFLNCSNLFEDLTKLLSKNAFSVQSLLTANSLSLSALLAIVENIELENSIKQNISTDRLTMLQNSINNMRAPPSSGYTAAKHLNNSLASNNTNQSMPLKTSIYKHTVSSSSNRSAQRINRMKINTDKLPTTDELKSVRVKKRLINQSVDLFNTSPSKSIQFLKDNNIFSSDTDVFIQQLIKYLKETPALEKKVIGEYLSSRKNIAILEEFVRSFNFENLRIDEALRLFLETFRLPGEAPLISIIMENFAKHWRSSNSGKFANDDAAFTLAYAIIMLNVDQHNHNVKKQSTPMIVEEFKKNLSRVNGGGNFDDELLEEIYYAVKNEEIVMPSEHTGLVRENYLWKVLIRRGHTSDSHYVHAPAGSYNQEIFNIVWGQTISALSFVYDKSLELSVIQKAINGFRKCAQVAAHYMMSDVFDNIVISLCKFTALSSPSESVDQIAVNFGMNNKAQLACKTVFQLTQSHGDILRDGWKNILDCIIQLYKAKLLPRVLVECEDYLNPNGRILLIKEEVPIIQKPEGSGLFSSFFPFMSSDLTSNKGPTQEEQEATKNAQSCVDECHIEQLIHDTKFLRVDSLLELVKALIFLSQINDIDIGSVSTPSSTGQMINSNTMSSGINMSNNSNNSSNVNSVNSSIMNSDYKYDVDAAVFSLEILIKVVLQNRDRISCIWTTLRNHFYNIIINTNEYSFFLERTVVGLLRITARLLRREELANEVLSSLRMLLLFKKKSIIKRLSRQVSFGIHDLLRTNAANIYSNDDWANIFNILQVYGAGASAPIFLQQQQQQLQSDSSRSMLINKSLAVTRLSNESKAQSNENLNNFGDTQTLSDRGYTSDSELYQQQQQSQQTQSSNSTLMGTSDQALNQTLNKKEETSLNRTNSISSATNQANQYKIDLDDEGLGQHDKKAFAKCCETLTLLIRDMAHITLQNFESCIHCLRTFVEACVLGDHIKENKKELVKKLTTSASTSKLSSRQAAKQLKNQQQLEAAQSQWQKRSHSPRSDDSDEDDQFITSYETISIQLLDLLDTLHIKAASIFTVWAEEQRHITQQSAIIDSVVSNLWSKCWCPILQGIARLSCDNNGEVRMHALQYLQRALLVHELQKLSAMEWEACFNKVLFPLLAKLLENIDPKNVVRMEETRMRATSLLCKVFLQHLTTLARLSTFTALWLTILDYMDKYMKSDKSDLLHDVIPESLKNMLLVMETTGLFNQTNPDIKFSQLCNITKDRIESFLPGLWEDLFRENNNNKTINNTSTPVAQDPNLNKSDPNLNEAQQQNDETLKLASPNQTPKSVEIAASSMHGSVSNEQPVANTPTSLNSFVEENLRSNPELADTNTNSIKTNESEVAPPMNSPLKNKSITEIKDI